MVDRAELAGQKYFATITVGIADLSEDGSIAATHIELEFGTERDLKWYLLTTNGYVSQWSEPFEARVDPRLPLDLEFAVRGVFSDRADARGWSAPR